MLRGESVLVWLLLRLRRVERWSGRQRILLEIDELFSNNKSTINHKFTKIFDSWCRTITSLQRQFSVFLEPRKTRFGGFFRF